ncbi:hypothetical protein RhiJN_07076 [Ceratobasidium sp. AG-Ba]|nr:hypothetical protein RhiJN_07076 [Ceratobasidium sp. AG-Ba]QRW07956.1 hypothetical protein RhiLY_06955 [Ceratobasidium sp. AG-Ba]
MPSPTSSQKGASPRATTPEPSDASSKPVWASGPEQITVELLFAGLYNIDVDIAKRMNIIHGKSKTQLRVSKDLVTVTACSAKDFEEALTFCANDRECAQPPTPTLARIQSEMDPTPAAPIKTRKTRASIGRVVHDESDTEDASYVPSDSEDDTEEEDEDDDDEEEDIKEEDVGAELEDLRAERQEHGEASSPTTAGVAKRLGNLQIAKDDEDEDEEEDESYVPSSDSEASDSADEYSDTDMADMGTSAIKAERDEFKAKQGASA